MRIVLSLILCGLLILTPSSSRADMFGGDVAVLMQILAETLEEVIQLKSILDTGSDTLDLMRDINSGLKNGLDAITTLDPKFSPGTYGNLNDPNSVMRALSDVYGRIPDGMDHDLIQSQDQSVAEVISMNRNLYDYADSVDRERERILYHAEVVSPQGAGKLQNQALGVLIGVSTQLLRTQSQMMKILAQDLALQTRKEKLATQNAQDNYQGLSQGFKTLPKTTNLPRLTDGL